MKYPEPKNPEMSNTTPFGDEDASRSQSVESIEKIGSKGFVKIEVGDESGIYNGGDFRYRVIVGKKGSGKTLYLRRSHIKLIENATYTEDLTRILEEPKQTRPETQLILKFSQQFNGEFLTEKWRELWRRAIIRTLVTHILYGGELGRTNPLLSVKKALPDNFSKKYKKILSKARLPITVFSQVIEIIESVHDGNDFNKFCNNILWAELDYTLGPLIKDSKPLYFYVDAIDDEYQHAPMYWMRVQKGLFYSVMQFLRDGYYGGRLHILISIRDHVYSSILQSEHKTRYLNSEHITVLKWNPRTALYLLQEKIRVLDDKYFIIDGEKSIYNWLGIKEIRNSTRNIKEPIIDYILRHTRAIPRDVISLGNIISDKILEYKKTNKSFSSFESILRRLVNDKAWNLGDEQLSITANHLTSNLTPSEAVELGIDKMFTSSYTGEQEFLNLHIQYKSVICDVIKSIGKDRFSLEELNKAKAFTSMIFNTETDLNLFNILWQNGLIGYETNENTIFFDEMSTEFSLPINKSKYVFPSILIDRLELTPIGNPVYLNYRNSL